MSYPSLSKIERPGSQRNRKIRSRPCPRCGSSAHAGPERMLVPIRRRNRLCYDMVPHILLTLVLLLCCMTPSTIAADESTETALQGGTIVSIDQEASTLTIRMPSGESRSLPVIDRRLLQGLSIGNHVSFELDQDNRLIKINKLPIDPAN